MTQGGYVSSQQAKRAGYDRQHLAYHVRVGNLVRVDWGLYRVPGLPISEHDDLIRWTLWSRDRIGEPQAVVGHESALAAHDLSDALPTAVHLVVPPGFRKPAPRGCRLHRADLASADVEAHEGFELTTPIRTLLDLADRADVPARTLRRAVVEALERGKVRLAVLRTRARGVGLEARLGIPIRGAERRKA